MLRRALVLLLAVVFCTLGTTATATAVAVVGSPGAQVSVTAGDTPGSADVVRAATPAVPHAAPPGPLAVTPDPVPIPRPLAAVTGPEPTAAAARAGVGSTTDDRAPPGAAR